MALRTPLSVTPHLYMGDSTGRPLDNGVVYFGEQDKDPEFYPINLFSDDALTTPLMQPVHTKGGYLYDKGDMVEPHAKELIYSVKVLDSYGRKVFYKGAMMRNSWNDDVIEQINAAIISSADVARQVATDITNEAINNTAVDGGVLADTFVTMTKKSAIGSVARNLRDVNGDILSATDFGLVGDGSTDDSVNLQKALTHQDAARTSSTFIPMQYQNYILDGSLVLQEPSMIYGNKGACYNRGLGKNGNLVLRNTLFGIDLGNSRTWDRVSTDVNPADNWTIKNIGITRHESVAFGTQVGIKHTAATNGPDRAFILDEVSIDGMDNALLVVNNGFETQLATLIIEKSVLSGNKLAINAEGSIYGARIAGNQIEQCGAGSIHGNFSGPLTVHDNMLEGTGNTINLTRTNPENLTGVALSLERNYFEANYGEYILKMEGVGNSLVSRGNYFSGFHKPDDLTPIVASDRAVDHYLLTGVFNTLEVYDKPTITFFDTFLVRSKHNLDRFLFYAYKNSDAIGIIVSDYSNKFKVNSNTKYALRLNNIVETPLGDMHYLCLANETAGLDQSFAANDVVQVQISYVNTGTGEVPNTAWMTIADSTILGGAVVADYTSNGIKTLNMIITIPSWSPSGNVAVRLDIDDPTKRPNIKLLAVTAEKLGVVTRDTATPLVNRFATAIKNPVLNPVSKGAVFKIDIGASTLAAGATKALGFQYVVGVPAKPFISSSLTLANGDGSIEVIVVADTTAATVTISLKNTGTTAYTFTATDFLRLSVKAY